MKYNRFLLFSLIRSTFVAISFPCCFAFISIPFTTRKGASPIDHRILSSATTEDLERIDNDFGEDEDFDDFDIVKYYSEMAISHRGEPEGLFAVRILTELCQNRKTYDFESHEEKSRLQNNKLDSVVSRIPTLLSANTTTSFLDTVRLMETNGWLSQNPDSVDGLPSLHLNLVSNGKPKVPLDIKKEDLTDFEYGTQTLLKLIHHEVYDELLPEVNRLLNSKSITISDVFLRRYGEEVCGNLSRNGISAHYDVFSRITSVIALDNVGADGRNGLYTTHKTMSLNSTQELTSTHAALRRFFPLRRGDAVIHSWDVLHGVDVEPGLDRTSLIVWFQEDDVDTTNEDNTALGIPWLTNNPNVFEDNVAQFVLASALSSFEGNACDDGEDEVVKILGNELSVCELCLQSAAQENSFALTRIGNLITDGTLSESFLKRAENIVNNMRPLSRLPMPIIDMLSSQDSQKFLIGLAMRFWFEGAVRGNSSAQVTLADSLMVEASQSGDADTRLLAAVLFALAAQQGFEEAPEQLSRVIDFDFANQGYETEAEFLASPIVQVAEATIRQ